MADDRERKKHRERWLELNRKYETSGMTRENFCAQEKIHIHTFDDWRGRLKKEGLVQEVSRRNGRARKQPAKKTKMQPNALVPVVITQPAESRQEIQIKTSKGHTVSIPVSVCPTILKEVFKALGDL